MSHTNEVFNDINIAPLVRSGMFDTSRTPGGIPYFVQNGHETVPNPKLVRKRRGRADGYFIETPDGNFPNGPIWSVNIPGGLGSTIYAAFTLFPNPDKQTVSTAGSREEQIINLDGQVRRFFDTAVTLIESGDYQYGPNNTLIPTERQQKIRRFEKLVENPHSEARVWVDSAIEGKIAPNTSRGRQRLIAAIAAITTLALVGADVPNDPDGIGRRELDAEELNLPKIESEFQLKGKINLQQLVKHLVEMGAIQSSKERTKQRERNMRVATGGGVGRLGF